MSTEGFAYGEQLPVRRPRELAYGDVAPPPPEVEVEKEALGPLDRGKEAILGLAIVTSVAAAYGVIGYGIYALLGGV
jgi:hypothetical protein